MQCGGAAPECRASIMAHAVRYDVLKVTDADQAVVLAVVWELCVDSWPAHRQVKYLLLGVTYKRSGWYDARG
jgi:hypothetical protein